MPVSSREKLKNYDGGQWVALLMPSQNPNTCEQAAKHGYTTFGRLCSQFKHNFMAESRYVNQTMYLEEN